MTPSQMRGSVPYRICRSDTLSADVVLSPAVGRSLFCSLGEPFVGLPNVQLRPQIVQRLRQRARLLRPLAPMLFVVQKGPGHRIMCRWLFVVDEFCTKKPPVPS